MDTLQLLLLFAGAACTSGQYNTDTCQSGRTVIVHLFNWKWTDIAAECERFLGPVGFCGVQVSPPNEHRVVTSPFRPWWERYQPVSYLLESRSGSRDQFIDMVQRCHNVGVGIYVDLVVNHMTGSGGTGTGSGGSYYDANDCCLSFPVPYGVTDFNSCGCGDCCSGSCDIENYGDPNQVRNCRLVSLLDLKLSSDYVRTKIADFLNDLIDIGVGGFRVDACKHMWPGDIDGVYSMVNDLNSNYFPAGTRPFMFLEVIDLGGEPITGPEYTHLGRVTEFKFSASIGDVFRNWNGQKLSSLETFGEGWGFLPDGDSLVFVDNHDNQRGHGAGGEAVLTHKDPQLYKRATAFKLGWPYGFTRIMSSYEWGDDADAGPPSNGDEIADVPINPDGSCGAGWLCEHRWRQITNMVTFRNVANGQPSGNWWDNGENQIAFSRGNKGFLAINGDGYDMNEVLQTGLPGGTYCDVIGGDISGETCTGSYITVNGDGTASISISTGAEDTMIAIHELSKLGSGPPTTTPPSNGTTTAAPPPVSTEPPPAGAARTVIFQHFLSSPGEDLFLRGGIDGGQGCSVCTVGIQHNSLGSSSHYDKHNAWSVGDSSLDWSGAETGQGDYQGTQAEGSPAAWTSNSDTSTGYQPLNLYGEHYWMIDVDMNCDDTSDGWFEFKGFVAGGVGWESDVTQSATCTGTAGGSKPYTSGNHMGRCGFINVFSFNDGGCEINSF